MQFQESAPNLSNNRSIEKNYVVLDKTILASLDEKHSEYFSKRNEAMKKRFGDFFNAPLNSERVVEKYFKELSLTPELLQDKDALYLGSAKSMLDEYCEKKYGTSFTSVDIDQENLGDKHPLGVVADARALPFKADSFDLVISLASMPHMLVPFSNDIGEPVRSDKETDESSSRSVESLFREVYRVLKPGGEARFSTFSEGQMSDIRIESEEDRNDLDQQLARIYLIKRALQKFKEDSGSQCKFIDVDKGGLIIIKKPDIFLNQAATPKI